MLLTAEHNNTMEEYILGRTYITLQIARNTGV